MESPPVIIAAEDAAPARSTAQLLVRLTVMPSCGMRSPAGGTVALLDFGTVGPASTPLVTKVDRESSNALTLRCNSRYATPLVALSGGANASGARRYLSNGPVRVGYDLFRDPALSQPWTPGVAYPVPVRAPDRSENIGIYGRIPAPEQATATGTYADVVLVTVTY